MPKLAFHPKSKFFLKALLSFFALALASAAPAQNTPAPAQNLSPLIFIAGYFWQGEPYTVVYDFVACCNPAFDPEGDALTFDWSLSPWYPSADSIIGSQDNFPQVTVLTEMSYVLRCAVSDGVNTSVDLRVINNILDYHPIIPPSVSFISHGVCDLMEPGTDFWFWIEASSGTGVASVELYRNGELLEVQPGNGTGTYLFPWNESQLGPVIFNVIVTDQNGFKNSQTIIPAFWPATEGYPDWDTAGFYAGETLVHSGGLTPAGWQAGSTWTHPNCGNNGGGNNGGNGGGNGGTGAVQGLTPPSTGPLGLGEVFSASTSGADLVIDAGSYTGSPGAVVLVEVVIASEEYPNWTGTASEYNDVVQWEIKSSWGAGISKTEEVNSLHAKFTDSGEAIVGLYAFTFPNNPEAANRKLTFKGSLKNVGDGVLDTAVQFRVLPVALQEVRFSGGKYYELKSDDGTVTYSAPHWADADGNGQIDREAGEANKPVAYKRNTKATLATKVSIGAMAAPPTVQLRGTAINGLGIAATALTAGTGNIFSLPPTQAMQNFDDKIQFYNADGENPAGITWELNVNGTGWFTLAKTKHTVYVVNDELPENALRHETLFNIACRNANGMKGDTVVEKQAIVNAIYGEFTDRDVRKVVPSTGTSNESSLSYWKSEYFSSEAFFSTTHLLVNGDGNCGMWAKFFIDALRTQGLDSQLSDIRPLISNSTQSIYNLYVQLSGNIASTFPGHSSGWEYGIIFFIKNWGLAPCSFTPDDRDGIPAQENANPIAYFSNHGLVKYNEKYYDPSYGTGPFASLLLWEKGSIEGYGAMISSESAFVSTPPANVTPVFKNGFYLWVFQLDDLNALEVFSQNINY